MWIENKPVYVEKKDHLLDSSMRRLNVTSSSHVQVKRRGKTEYIAVKKICYDTFPTFVNSVEKKLIIIFLLTLSF